VPWLSRSINNSWAVEPPDAKIDYLDCMILKRTARLQVRGEPAPERQLGGHLHGCRIRVAQNGDPHSAEGLFQLMLVVPQPVAIDADVCLAFIAALPFRMAAVSRSRMLIVSIKIGKGEPAYPERDLSNGTHLTNGCSECFLQAKPPGNCLPHCPQRASG
jgi:hypothetical protein